MSFDLAVWFAPKRIGNEEAGELYVRLCDGDTSGVLPHPAVDEVYAELTARYPEIAPFPPEKNDEHDSSPWSCKLDHSPGHVILSCVWPRATEVGRLVQNLARQHGLASYDPQSGIVTYPDGSAGTKTDRRALWILGACALLFAAIFVYVGQISPAGSSLLFYVFAGLCGLMAVACFRQALR